MSGVELWNRQTVHFALFDRHLIKIYHIIHKKIPFEYNQTSTLIEIALLVNCDSFEYSIYLTYKSTDCIDASISPFSFGINKINIIFHDIRTCMCHSKGIIQRWLVKKNAKIGRKTKGLIELSSFKMQNDWTRRRNYCLLRMETTLINFHLEYWSNGSFQCKENIVNKNRYKTMVNSRMFGTILNRKVLILRWYTHTHKFRTIAIWYVFRGSLAVLITPPFINFP